MKLSAAKMRQNGGATYDQGKLNRSAERLRQLGYFEDVQVTTAPVPEDEQQMDVSVAVKERATAA